MKRLARPRLPAWTAVTPAQTAIVLNLVIALLVFVAVLLHLRTEHAQELRDTQVRVAHMARTQALSIADQLRTYDALLRQLETRVNVVRAFAQPMRHDAAPLDADAMYTPQEPQEVDLLRHYLDLTVNKVDLLLVQEDGNYLAASHLLGSSTALVQYCPGLLPLKAATGSSSIQAFAWQGTGRCPPDGTLVYQRPLRSTHQGQAQSFWLLFGPDLFHASLQSDLRALAGQPMYRIVGPAGELLLASSPQAAQSDWWTLAPYSSDEPLVGGVQSAQWRPSAEQGLLGAVSAEVEGSGLRVQILYQAEVAIAPTWQPYAWMWASVAAGFLLVWALLSYFAVAVLRRHQADIAAREQRFDRSLSFAGVGVWEWNLHTGDFFSSKHAAAMAGYPMEDLHVHFSAVMEHIHPEDRERVQQSMQESMHSGNSYFMVHRMLCVDGSVRWLQSIANVLRDAAGKPEKMSGVVQDITEQRASQHHQHLLESVVSQLNDLVYIVEPEPLPGQQGRRIVFVNDAFVAQTGYSREEILGQTIHVLFGAQTDVRELERIAQAMQERQPSHSQLLAYARNGEAYWADINVQPLLEADGTLSNWVVVARDITQRKLAETALRESQSRLSGIFESAMDAIICVDEDHRIILFNAGAEHIFGHSTQAMLGQPLDGLLPHGLRSLHAQHLARYQASAADGTFSRTMGSQGSLRALRASGEEFPIEASISRAQVGGRMIFTVIVRDITQRVQAERALLELNETLEQRVRERTTELQLALQSAEQAKRTRGDFLAKMSHEMRTPMNAVLGLTYLALRHQPSAQQEQFLQKIQRAGEHLLHTINDILDFSKIDAGKLVLEVSNFDVRRTLDAVLQMFEVKAREKSLALTLELDAAVPPMLAGDALRLQQILINYVNNAIKFTERGQVCVRVRTEPKRPGSASGSVYLRLEVQDSGMGVSAEQQPRLFESFEQADNSTTRRFGGTGLGLAICKQLAALMGGEVGCSSEMGQGSVFWCTVCLQQPSAERPVALGPSRDEALQVLRGKRILVVDDNDLNLEVALGILRDWQVEALQACDGLQALEVLRTAPVDLVLMDMHMPHMDGLEATRRIRSEPAWADLPVLAMTANARSEDHERCLQAGMGAVITKPFVPERLLLVLCRWLLPPQAQHWSESRAWVDSSQPPSASSGAQSGFAIWDPSCLERFVGSDRAVQQRFVRKFQKAAQGFMDALAQRQTLGWDDLTQMAHKIKSSARTVGALHMAELCEQMERAGKAEDALQCEALVFPLEQSFAQTQAVIAELLAQDGAGG